MACTIGTSGENKSFLLPAFFFNHFAATNLTGFSETLSLAKKSLSLAKKSLSLAEKIVEFREKLLILGNKFGI